MFTRARSRRALTVLTGCLLVMVMAALAAKPAGQAPPKKPAEPAAPPPPANNLASFDDQISAKAPPAQPGKFAPELEKAVEQLVAESAHFEPQKDVKQEIYLHPRPHKVIETLKNVPLEQIAERISKKFTGNVRRLSRVTLWTKAKIALYHFHLARSLGTTLVA